MSIKVMNRVWESSSHEGSTLLVLLALADHASDDGVCYPGIPRLARKARISARHTKRLVTELEDSGEVYADRTGGRQRTSLYFIVLGFNEDEITQTLAKRFEMPHPEAVKEARKIIDKRDRKGDAQDTLSGQKDDAADTVSDEKDDIQDQERVTPMSETVTPVSQKGDVAVSPEPSLTVINSSVGNHQKELTLAFPEKALVIESIIAQTQTHPDQFDLGRRTEAARSASGNYAVPARAGGDDGLADLALQKLYEFSGSEAPAEGKERDRQRDKVAEVLKAYGCADAPPKVVEEAACLHCAAKGEFVNVYYTSFPADFGKYLGQARASHKKKDDYRVRVTEANEEAQAALEAKPKPPLRERTIWDNVLDALATQVGRNEFRTYLADTWLIGQENGTLRVAVGSAFDKDWIENRLGLTIKRALAGLANAPGGIVFEVES